MKILLSIVVCFCFVLISYSFHEQIQNPEKFYFIHKTKRPFVKKGDREYLKKKGVEYFNKNHLPTVDEKIRIAQQKEKTGNLKGAFYDYNLALLIDPVNPELLYLTSWLPDGAAWRILGLKKDHVARQSYR